MQKVRSHEWDVGIQGCRINEGRLYYLQQLPTWTHKNLISVITDQ